MSVPVAYEQRCQFCGQLLVSIFWDDIESHIMACRELALPDKRGDLAAHWEKHSQTLTCEGEPFRKQVERSGRRGPGGGP